MDIHSITHAYQECERQIDRMRLQIHMHAHEVNMTQQFLATLNRPPVENYRGTYASVGFSAGCLQGVIVQFSLEKHEGFPAAEPVLEFLLTRGWVVDGMTEDAEFGNREFKFKQTVHERPLFWPAHHEWKSYQLTATVRVWPHVDSEVCRKVQVGVKPDFKYECIK